MIKRSSYWWEAAPPVLLGEDVPVPAKADVVIVGGGYSGISIALFLARAGRDVVVLEQGRPGENASTVNFGAAGRTIRPKFSTLQEEMGTEAAIRVFTEAKAWMEFCFAFIRDEKI
ncbi:MAG: NAD(P)/FAD-dependent oxidoreductase, partial [Alphaproteobacteria bacterium]